MWPRSEVLGLKFFRIHSDFLLNANNNAKTQIRLCANNWESLGLKPDWKVQTLKSFSLPIDNAYGGGGGYSNHTLKSYLKLHLKLYKN
jgi:hypothetical protein